MSKQISLTQGKFAIVDDEDFANVGRFKWSLWKWHNQKYTYSGTGQDRTVMTTMIFYKKQHRLNEIWEVNE